jgi:hypothetical protein
VINAYTFGDAGSRTTRPLRSCATGAATSIWRGVRTASNRRQPQSGAPTEARVIASDYHPVDNRYLTVGANLGCFSGKKLQ